jgi:hypothetical protein
MNKSDYCHFSKGSARRSEAGGGGPPVRHSRGGGNRVLRIPIIILLALSPRMAHAGLRETLTSALQTYCIPKDTASCDSALRPRYQGNACYCGDSTYLRYNATLRTCEVFCPAGQMPEKAAGGCQAGYGGLLIKDF